MKSKWMWIGGAFLLGAVAGVAAVPYLPSSLTNLVRVVPATPAGG